MPKPAACTIILLFLLIASAGCIGDWKVVSAPSQVNASVSEASPGISAPGAAGEMAQAGKSNQSDGGNTPPISAQEPASVPKLEKLAVEPGSLPAYGNGSAPVAWIEFSDYQCPYCERLFSQADGSVRENYVTSGKVRMYFRDFPLGFHDKSQDAALAARCAERTGKYWEMHDKIFSGQDSWSGLSRADAVAEFKSYASSLGISTSNFSSCLSSAATVSEVALDQQEGGEYGVAGTPAVFLVLPMNNTDYNALAKVADGSGGGVTIFDGGADYVVLVGGAYPYSTFSGILDAVKYD